jgi:hypothetical protein
MSFEDDVRRGTASAFEALAEATAVSVREELGAIRAALDQRIAAVEAALAKRDSQILDRLVEDLSREAAKRTDDLLAQARDDMQREADARLAAAQSEAQLALDAERSANVTLLANFEGARQQLEELQRSSESFVQLRSNVEAELARERTAKAELEAALAATQAAASTAEDAACEQAALVETNQRRLLALEAERDELKQARDEAQSRAAAAAQETNPQVMLERVKKALRAFSGVTSAQAIFDALVEQLAQEFATVALFLHRRNRLEGWRSRGLDSQTDIGNLVVPLTIDSPMARAVSSSAPVTIEPGSDGVKVGVFGQTIARAVAWPVQVSGTVVAVVYVQDAAERVEAHDSASRQIAEILIEHVGRCLVMGRRASMTPADRPETVAAGRQQGAIPPAATEPAAAPPAPAAAPAAAEPSAIQSPMPPVVAEQAAAGVNRAPAAETAPSEFPAGTARQVDRVRIREGVEVSVDGTTGQLVDLSALGAQVVSPKSIRPQQLVRLVLSGRDGPFSCKGRIMWARFEKPRKGDSGLYRAGMKFTEADAAAIAAFIEEYEEKNLALPARTG